MGTTSVGAVMCTSEGWMLGWELGSVMKTERRVGIGSSTSNDATGIEAEEGVEFGVEAGFWDWDWTL